LEGLKKIISLRNTDTDRDEMLNRGVKLTTHLHLVPTSRMRGGAIPPLPQYAFMALCSVKAQVKLYLHLKKFGMTAWTSFC
jgi:hypothetical protein